MIDVQDLSYTYTDGSKAVQNISVTFPEQGIIAIMGLGGEIGRRSRLKIYRALRP